MKEHESNLWLDHYLVNDNCLYSATCREDKVLPRWPVTDCNTQRKTTSCHANVISSVPNILCRILLNCFGSLLAYGMSSCTINIIYCCKLGLDIKTFLALFPTDVARQLIGTFSKYNLLTKHFDILVLHLVSYTLYKWSCVKCKIKVLG